MFSPQIKPVGDLEYDTAKLLQNLTECGLTQWQWHIANMCLQCHTQRDFIKWHKIMPPECYPLMESIRQLLLAMMMDLLPDSDLPDMTNYWRTL